MTEFCTSRTSSAIGRESIDRSAEVRGPLYTSGRASKRAARCACLDRLWKAVSNSHLTRTSRDVPGTPMVEVVKGWKHLLKGEYASKRDFEFVLIGRRAYKLENQRRRG